MKPMHRLYLISLSILIMMCCNNSVQKSESEFKDQAFASAQKYLSIKTGLQPTNKTDDLFLLKTEDSSTYICKKKNILLGDLNADKIEDAIVSYQVVDKENTIRYYHLVFINISGELIPLKVTEKEMQVKQIINGIVIAEHSKLASDAPNYGCKLCIEKIKLKLIGDSLALIP